MLALLKGLPSTYNKDLQLDKTILFQSHDDLKLVFDLTLAVVDTMQASHIAILGETVVNIKEF